jgi:hypothetical protein
VVNHELLLVLRQLLPWRLGCLVGSSSCNSSACAQAPIDESRALPRSARIAGKAPIDEPRAPR